METDKKSRYPKLILVALLCLLSLSIVGYFGYQKCQFTFVKNGVEYKEINCRMNAESKQSSNNKDESEKKVKAKIYTDEKSDYWEIVDKSRNLSFPTGMKFFKKDIPEQTVVRWKNYLLGINFEKYIDKSSSTYFGATDSEIYTLKSKISYINVYNIDTNESSIIPLDQPIFGEFWYVANQIVDNTYYFGVGGAFGPSLSYKIDLPPQKNSKITKFNPIGSEIKKIGNSYVSSFCYEGCTYSLFNPVSLSSTPLTRMNEAFNDRSPDQKEELVGIDGRGNMIAKNKSNNDQIESIISSPLNNLKVTNTLLKVSSDSDKIEGYFAVKNPQSNKRISIVGQGEYQMVDGIDKLLILGNYESYIYDLSTQQFKPLQTANMQYSVQKISKPYKGTDEQSICFQDQSGINMVTEKYIDQSPDCRLVRDTPKSIEEMFQELNLPDNFELVYTPLTYKTYRIEQMPESKLPFGVEVIE